ncbi:TcpE family conjugal transfer membrane protein [Carnobacterium divergens]|uniref:TcpE family conjugal transfer membrane protein n=1 Tax=Carnobacterium divergens TaxID=2748 RepID=UPI00289237FE|nr:TcpE family conjugal transfer membrane protein [Carnobacterium divergens]MDT2010822.1 conjugal transfer protein [Carnobacterium divergens]
MKEKYVFDYKEPFNAPLVIRKLTDNFSLNFNLYAFDVVVYVVSCLFLYLILHWFIPFASQLGVLIYIGVPFLVVKIFATLEPDGKKVHVFLIDYAKFLLQYQLPKKGIYHGEKIILFKEKVIYK